MNNAKFVDMNNELEIIAENAKNTLIEEFNIHIPQAKVIATMAYVYIKEVAKEIKDKDDDVNVFEMFSIGKHDNEVILTPGQEFKLLIKDDK